MPINLASFSLGLSESPEIFSEWTPFALTGLNFWLDATDISTLYQNSIATIPVTTDNQEVGAWIDKVSNISKCIQSTTNRFPLYKINGQGGKPGILFDGINDYLVVPDVLLDGAATVILVMNTVSLSAGGTPIVLSRNTGNTYYMWMTNTNSPLISIKFYDTGEKAATLTSTDIIGGNIIGMSNIEGAPVTIYRNGVPVNGPVCNIWGSQGASRLGIWRDNVSFPYNGYICEVLIYDRVLDSYEMAKLHSYLGKKWSISTVQQPIGNPLGISDNIFWLDASKITGIENTPISVISDISGHELHAFQNIKTKQGIFKTNVQGGLSGILFDGADDFYTLLNQVISISTEFSVFGVYKILSHTPPADPMLIAFTNNDALQPWVGEMFYKLSDPQSYFSGTYGDGSGKAAIISSSPLGSHVFGMSIKETDNIYSYLDDQFASGAISTVFTCPYSTTNAKIGANIDGLSRWMYGYLCELMAWKKVLNLTERQIVIEYLTDKWGINQ